MVNVDRPESHDSGGGRVAPTFLEPELEEQFLANGFVVVDFLTPEALRDLRSLCEHLHVTPGSTWESDFYDKDSDRKRAAHAGIAGAFQGPIRRYFARHHSLLHNFVLNWPGPDGGLQLHQHSSLVDESRFRSALVWCALTDATESNGTLHLVPRSHRIQEGPRPERSPSWFDPHADLLLDQYLVSVPIAAGQAIIFDNQMLHASFANSTESCRRTAAAVVVPDAAIPRYYDPGDGFEAAVYRLDPEHFLENAAGNLQWASPDGLELLESVPWSVRAVTAEDLEVLLDRGTCSHSSGRR